MKSMEEREAELNSKNIDEYTNQDIIDYLTIRMARVGDKIDTVVDKKIYYKAVSLIVQLSNKVKKLENILLEKGIIDDDDVEMMKS